MSKNLPTSDNEKPIEPAPVMGDGKTPELVFCGDAIGRPDLYRHGDQWFTWGYRAGNYYMGPMAWMVSEAQATRFMKLAKRALRRRNSKP